jgi:hypothetical protein
MATVSLSSFLKTSSYWSKRAGVRLQFFLGAALLWAVSTWLRNEYGQEDSNLWLVMNQFIRLLLWTVIVLFGVSVLAALATWGYFLSNVKNKKITVQAKFGDGQKAEAGLVPITILIQGPALRPLLGTIQARLVFSEKRLSERVILDVDVPRHKGWRQAIKGTGQTMLYDRGIYDVEQVAISFCDMLGLVSLPCLVPLTQQLYTLPLAQKEQHIKAQPHATEQQTQRIEIPKRVEGEHVNYKEFEAGDNIQRIVWKIYAKSGQLVVRIPETKDPYASHLYFYASFFYGFAKTGGAFEIEMLNVYKDGVRNLLEALQRNGYDVRMPYDQEVARLNGVSDKKNELFQIAASSWQHQIPPVQFVSATKAAFVCLSSLTPVNEVESLIQILPTYVPLVVVKLSEAIPSPFKISARDIFFRPEKHPSDPLRQPWLISSMRRELKKNERQLEIMLKQRGNSWLTSRLTLEQ